MPKPTTINVKSGASTALAWCDPFARNRPSGRGLGGREHLCSLTTLVRCWCDDTSFVSSSPTPEVVRVTASSPAWRLVLNGQKRAETAECGEPDVVIPSSRWLRLTMSEAVVEASSSRTCPRWLRGRPKRDMYPGYVVKRNVVTTRTDTGVKQRPKVTTHQSVERSNPLSALGLDRAGNQPHAPAGGMPSACPELVEGKPRLWVMPEITFSLHQLILPFPRLLLPL